MFYCSRQLGAAILNTRETKKVRLGSPVPANFTIEVMFYCSRQLCAAILNTRETKKVSHIGIPSVPRFSLTGPNKSPILPKNTDFHTQNHRFYRKTQGISPAHEGISPTPLFFDHVIHGRRHLGSRDPLSTNQSAGLDAGEDCCGKAGRGWQLGTEVSRYPPNHHSAASSYRLSSSN
ncbi:hypothetical protein J6590_104366 [Homalodisca vitripennis]|nr:hypothetical protein J6590_104366 [Homalodisca vitripennis]